MLKPAPGSLANFPLSALVGQEEMVAGLMLLAVDPSLGGLLLVGEKGTAKSTAARALAELLPGSPPRPAPFRTVPLSVTEDRLLGGLDWESAIRSGRPVLQPGLLNEADGGLLYIDEVNLLEPGLAHLILDAVSVGRVLVEREGLSAELPARVALLATMNPEEGPLGPQLADRFALTVHLAGESEPARRALVVRRRLEFEADPYGFRSLYAARTAALAGRIAAGRERLKDIRLTAQAQALAADLAREHHLAGHRGDLALGKAARARAALEGLAEAGPAEIRAVADLALAGRRRPAPARRPARIQVTMMERAEKKELFEPVYLADLPETPPEAKGSGGGADEEEMVTQIFKVGATFRAVTPQNRREVGTRERSGRRSARETGAVRGRSSRTSARRLGRPLSLAATLRAAAHWQAARRARAEGEARLLNLTPADFREKVYRQKTGRLVVFVVDSSGSIGTLYRMEEAKAAALALLAEAYQKRDRVALIAFYGLKAELLLPPTNSPDLAARLLAELPSGGKTPMAAALALAGRILKVEMAKDPALTPHVVVMTDGRPNIPLTPGANPWTEVLTLAGILAANPRLNFILIDTDRGTYNDYKLTRNLAERLRAPRLSLEDLREGCLTAWLNK